MKRIFFITMIILSTLILGYLYFADDLKIDGCLDRGGRWDYAKNICDKDATP